MYKILANTLFLGKDIHFLPECHSTNDIALQALREKEVGEGSIFITNHQTRGKGQRGNSWETKPGENLTFSLILQPRFLDLSEQFLLNMAISNAIRGCFQEYIPELLVKWPNDLVIPRLGKLGGILIENLVGSSGWDYAVVGIGLNINQNQFTSPQATSLSLATGNVYPLQELFKLLIVHLEQAYIALKKGKNAVVTREYLQYLYLFEEWAVFKAGDQEVEGKIMGLSETGNLLLELSNGQQRSFGIKEIAFPNF
ncbi:MAG: biotin--[acetyl-CoA-carboxylase] ligase [Bacteroidetes bacterium]|nr:biotin--[acetyl-CoA-carboxylase] ligase [Bacteroidota bacterium]